MASVLCSAVECTGRLVTGVRISLKHERSFFDTDKVGVIRNGQVSGMWVRAWVRVFGFLEIRGNR